MLLLNKTLIRMSKGLWGRILLIVALKLFSLVLTARFAQVISGFLGSAASASLDSDKASAAVLTALAAAVTMLLTELLIGEAEYRCTAKARKSLRGDIFSKALELDVGNIEKIGPVSAITASVDAVEAMQIYYSKYLPGLIYCLIAPIYLYFRLRPLSPSVALVLFAVSIVLMPLNNIFRSRIEKLKADYWTSLEDLTGYYLESIRGLTELKLFRQDDARASVLHSKAFDFNKKIMQVMKVNFRSFFLTDGLIYSAVFISAVMSYRQLALHRIDFSSSLMILLMSSGFFASVRSLMNATHSALAGVAAADKVEKLLSIDTSRPYYPNMPLCADSFDGIRIDNVSYCYPGRNPAVCRLSMDIPKDKVTAIVGLSGCGKSTAAGLLMKFFDPLEGHIYFEGRDYLSLTPRQLRKNIIMVPQTVSIFTGTVEENLRIAAPDASEAQLLKVLEQVRLKEWLDLQPMGLKSPVGDFGSRLSGGQRQKIGIARALLSNAPYIIFDEATSSVDIDSEQEIWSCISELSRTRTLIIISHRLSTIKDADCIYVLKNGSVSESGTHSQLMSENGLYKQLTDQQSALERHGEEVFANVR